MKLPRLADPAKYVGLFVADFETSTAVGYTAEEVALLLESQAYRRTPIYRICRVGPQGQVELIGVPPERFALESGLYFYRRDGQAARDDFRQLRALGESDPPPCRCRLVLVSLPQAGREKFVTGLEYPAECDQDVSGWLLANQVAAGDYVDGGAGRLAAVRLEGAVIDSAQLQPGAFRRSRSRAEVLGTIGQPLQRTV
jgi:hypothetical protein